MKNEALKKYSRPSRSKRRAGPSGFPRPPRPKSGITAIKVIGVGGGGGNVVTRMMEGERMRGVEFIAANTDAQDLNHSLAHKKIHLGKALTKGLGAGMNPEIGKQAAEESRTEIGEVLDGADVVFITAGMGGGTGTGASPVVAEVARDLGILTVAIVTKPFSFEGTQRMNIAQEGLMRLKDRVDTLVIIPNDRIFSIIDKDTSIAKAFSFVDEILKNAVQGIAELINMPGIINVDFADIKAIMKEAGTSLIGIGIAGGQDRGIKAAHLATSSPLLEVSIEGAKGVLFSIAGGRDLKMSEVNEIAKVVSANIDPGAKVIFGAYYDRHLREKNVKVTVIATGFNGTIGSSRFEMPTLFEKKPSKEDFLEELYKKDNNPRKEPILVINNEDEKGGDKGTKKVEVKNESGDSWDIPAFLRKKSGNKEKENASKDPKKKH